jgi:hypothetical protein
VEGWITELKRAATYLGIFNALQAVKEPLRGIHNGEIDAKGLGEILLDLLAFVQSHNAI